jgi:outer membrane biosynthesis protein TonB
MQSSHLNLFSKAKEEQKLEVSYLKAPPKPKEEPRPALPKKELLVKLPPKIIADTRIPPPFLRSEETFKINKTSLPQELPFTKPAFIKADIIAIKKKITLPPIDMNKINNPTYISYYQIVREKIKRAAYQNYACYETGEVYLSFIIANDGVLTDVRLVDEKSSSSPNLRGISLRSIKEASPFPIFPKELDYPHLSFNVIVSFEIE